MLIIFFGCKMHRNGPPEVFCKKDILTNFAKFTGKHLCQSLFFNKVVDLRSATLLKKRLGNRCFPVNFAKVLRTPFFTEHLRWLLLNATAIEVKKHLSFSLAFQRKFSE